MRRTWNWAGFTLCFAAGATLMWGHDRAAMVQTWLGPTPEIYATDSWSDADAAVPVTSADPAWGARTAPVTLVQFSDLTCGHCLELEATLAQLRRRYGPAQLRVVWKHLPHPANPEAESVHLAAEAVFRAAGPKAFWAFHEALVGPRHETTRATGSSDRADAGPTERAGGALTRRLEELAVAASADLEQFRRYVNDPATLGKVREDVALGRALGVKGTPSCFVNGVGFTGVQPQDAFSAEIDAELEASRTLRLRGTAADQIYVARTNAHRRPRETTLADGPTALREP